MTLADVILKGTRADQPSFLLVAPGTLYCVSDEDNAIEMNLGTAWVSYSSAQAALAITSLTGDVTAVGPGASAATIAALAVTTAKIAALAVTDAKLAADAVLTAKIIDAAVTNAKLANMAQATVKGRAAGAGTGVPTDLSQTQLTALINTFTTALSGAAPASGAAVGNFLRDDGTWAAAGGGGDWTQEIVKASNDDVTNSNVLTPDSELTFAVTSGNKYFFEALICLQGNDASVNYKWNIDHPGAANLNSVFGWYDYITNGGSPTHITAQGTTSEWPSAAGVQFGILAINVDMYMYAAFFVTPNANGNVVWQQANANAAVGRTSSTRIGSIMRMRQMNA